MEPGLLSAWQNLDKAIDDVLEAKPATLSKAATDLAEARQVFGEIILRKNAPKSSLFFSMKVKAVDGWRWFRGFLEEREKRWKASLLRTTVKSIFFVLFCGVVFYALYGSAVSMGYMVTAGGLILVALGQLLPYKFLQDMATLIGVALVGWWYVYTLPGVFNPYPNVKLDAEPQKSGYHVVVQVKDRKEVCAFDSWASQLSCKVWVAPVELAIPKK